MEDLLTSQISYMLGNNRHLAVLLSQKVMSLSERLPKNDRLAVWLLQYFILSISGQPDFARKLIKKIVLEARDELVPLAGEVRTSAYALQGEFMSKQFVIKFNEKEWDITSEVYKRTPDLVHEPVEAIRLDSDFVALYSRFPFPSFSKLENPCDSLSEVLEGYARLYHALNNNPPNFRVRSPSLLFSNFASQLAGEYAKEFIARSEPVLSRLEKNKAVGHSDFHGGNILVGTREGKSSKEVVIIDFERAGFIESVADLVTLKLDPKLRGVGERINPETPHELGIPCFNWFETVFFRSAMALAREIRLNRKENVRHFFNHFSDSCKALGLEVLARILGDRIEKVIC